MRIACMGIGTCLGKCLILRHVLKNSSRVAQGPRPKPRLHCWSTNGLMRAFPTDVKRSLSKLHLLTVLLVVAGIVSLSAYVVLLLQASAIQARLKRQFEQEIVKQQPRGDTQGRGAASLSQLSKIEIDGLARLDNPRAGLSAMVIEGADEATLRVAVGHIPGTP